MSAPSPIGFVGLGTMGEPMALNLVRSGAAVVVWNRTPARCAPLVRAGATAAGGLDDLFATCRTVILMLADSPALDAVLGRGTPGFAGRVGGHTIVSMGTVSANYSRRLSDEIRHAGGAYVEAPVSGSRKPAEAGQLVGLLAGAAEDLARVRPLLKPICKDMFACGEVPGALHMKLAVNTFLIALVTGLAEAAHFAGRHGLDLARFTRILDAGPMASEVSRMKLEKLVHGDFARQAGISDVLKNARLVAQAARSAGIASPLMDACVSLYSETESLGLAEDDMIAVIRALEQRTDHGLQADGGGPA